MPLRTVASSKSAGVPRARGSERRRRENRGAEGWGIGTGVPLPNRLRGLGERRNLPQWGQGRALADNAFLAYLKLTQLPIKIPWSSRV